MIQQRIPVDGEYAVILGKAIYVFAYYEWSIIWIIEHFEPGFVGRYSRGNPMTSSGVLKELKRVIDRSARNFVKITGLECEECQARFEAMIVKRNALIHAHPATDEDGGQILVYQTGVTRSLPDLKWPKREVEMALAEFDRAACEALVLLDKLRNA